MKTTAISIMLLLLVTASAQNETATTTTSSVTSTTSFDTKIDENGTRHIYRNGIEITQDMTDSWAVKPEEETPPTTLEQPQETDPRLQLTPEQLKHAEEMILNYSLITTTTAPPPPRKANDTFMRVATPVAIIIAIIVAILWKLGKPEVNEENE